MNEQMVVGVSLELKGDATPKLKAFQVNVDKLTKAVEAFNTKLGATGKLLNYLNTPLAKLVDSMKGLGASAGSTSRSFTGLNRSLQSADARMDKAAAQAARLKTELHGVAAAGEAAAAGVGGIRGGGRRGHGGGFMHSKALHIGPYGLSSMAFGAPGMAVAGVGYLGYKGFETQKEYQRELLQFSSQNLPGGSMAAADAWVRTQNDPLISRIQYATALADAGVITKDTRAAELIAPKLAEMRAVGSAMTGNKFSTAQQQAAIKVAELWTGSKDPKLLSAALDNMFKVGTGSGYRVMPTDFQAMTRAARGALTGSQQYNYMTDPNEIFALESLVQEQGGPQVGRMLAMLRNHIIAGRMTTASALDFQKLGLVKPGYAEYNKIGMIKRILPGGIVDAEKMDSFDWITKVYLPSLTKAGITDWNDIRRHALIDFTNTDSGLVQTIISQQHKIQSNIPINKGAMSLDQAHAALLKTPAGSSAKLGTAWSNFTLAFGSSTAGMSNALIGDLTTMLNFLTKLMNFFATAGNLIDKGMANLPSPVDWIGDKISNGFHNAVTNAANSHSSGNSSGGDIHVHVEMHGREIAHAIVAQQARMNSLDAISSLNRFNLSNGLTPPVVGTPSSL